MAASPLFCSIRAVNDPAPQGVRPTRARVDADTRHPAGTTGSRRRSCAFLLDPLFGRSLTPEAWERYRDPTSGR